MAKVVIVRKDKKVRHKILHALAFAATGGASGIVTAAEVASHAAYNARTRQLEAEDPEDESGQPPERWRNAAAIAQYTAQQQAMRKAREAGS